MTSKQQKIHFGLGSGFSENVHIETANTGENTTTQKRRPKMPSYKKVVDAHCKSCAYDPLSGLGTWRKQVEDCPCTSCDLYERRPKTLPKRADSQSKNQVTSEGDVGDST